LAGALQIARVDRRIGAKGKLRRTWLVTSQSERQLSRKEWLALEQQRWGIENRTHHTLDVTHREDQSRVREPNAASVLGLFRVSPMPSNMPGPRAGPSGQPLREIGLKRTNSTAGTVCVLSLGPSNRMDQHPKIVESRADVAWAELDAALANPFLAILQVDLGGGFRGR
jgi:hypothetical protein